MRVLDTDWTTRLEAIPEVIDSIEDPDKEIVTLLYALTDPDNQCAVAADNSLRQISGKVNGFGTIEKASDRERLAIIDHWVIWYFKSN